jgi:hypothetical protein
MKTCAAWGLGASDPARDRSQPRDRSQAQAGPGGAGSASLFQTSFQVGGAIVLVVLVVLAVVSAVVGAGGVNTLTPPAAVLSACRPALYLIMGVAAPGLLAALPSLRRGHAHSPDDVSSTVTRQGRRTWNVMEYGLVSARGARSVAKVSTE